jgi:hypothetical protein
MNLYSLDGSDDLTIADGLGQYQPDGLASTRNRMDRSERELRRSPYPMCGVAQELLGLLTLLR